jgi:hypothetical protein
MVVISYTATFAGNQSGTTLLRVAASVSRVCYLAVPGCLVASAIVSWPRLRLGHAEPWLRTAATAAATAFFCALLAVYFSGHVLVMQDFAADFVFSATLLSFVTMPLVFIAALSVVTFAYGIGQVTAGAARTAGPRLAWPVLCGLIAGQAVLLGWQQRAFWLPHPAQDAVVAGWLAAAGAVASLVRRREPDPRTTEDQHFASHSALTLSVPQLLAPALIAAFFLFKSEYTKVPAVANFIYAHFTAFSTDARLANDGERLLFAVMLVVALRITLARGETGRRRGLALGYVFTAAWLLATFLPGPLSAAADPATGMPSALRLPQIPLFICAAVIGVAVVRRGRLRRAELAFLAGLLAFGWLAETDGGFLDIVGGILGVPGNVTLIAGVALVLLGDSEFAGKDSVLLPRRARPLLWVGYIGVSLALTLLGQQVPIASAGASLSAFAFAEIGLPLALWLVLTGRLLPKPATATAEHAAAAADPPAAATPGGPSANPRVTPAPATRSSPPPHESVPSEPPDPAG